MILKLSLDNPSFVVLNLRGDLVWFLRKEGNVLSDLCKTSPSVDVVEDVYLRALFAFPSEPRALKKLEVGF